MPKVKKVICRITKTILGDFTYYTPEIRKKFLFTKYWEPIYADINSGSVYFTFSDYRTRNYEEAYRHLENYQKLSKNELYTIILIEKDGAERLGPFTELIREYLFKHKQNLQEC